MKLEKFIFDSPHDSLDFSVENNVLSFNLGEEWVGIDIGEWLDPDHEAHHHKDFDNSIFSNATFMLSKKNAEVVSSH